MSGNKSMRRAMKTGDKTRITHDAPKITDTTELVTPELAQEMLKKNTNNRPVNWNKVDEYAKAITLGEFELHAQGIVLDEDNNILTGQKRLWAIIYADIPTLMRISRGSPKSSARWLDRGTPQSARDLATRETGRKHAPTEAAIARAMCALRGVPKPSKDMLAGVIEANAYIVTAVLESAKGTKKTREVVMVLAAICVLSAESYEHARKCALSCAALASSLVEQLHPATAASCWGKGSAFLLAMQKAKEVVAAAAPV